MKYDKKSKAELIADIKKYKKKYKQASAEAEEFKFKANKCKKELNALFTITDFLHSHNIDLDVFLLDTINSLPRAFTYPEDISLVITFDGHSVKSRNFKTSEFMMSADISANKTKRGKIEIYYKKPHDEIDIGPFTKNERKLLMAYAEVAGRLLQRYETESAFSDMKKFNDTIITNAREGIIVYDKQFRYRVWNKYMVELTGIKEKDVLGKKYTEMIPYMKEQKLDEMLQKALDGHIVESDDTQYSIPGTGKKGWFRASYSPQWSKSGKIIGVIGTIRDITNDRKAEEELTKRGQKLREFASHLQSIREEERINIAREIHDELGQVLTALKINLSLIQTDIKQDIIEKHKDIFIEEIDGMHEIIDGTIKKLRKLITKLRPEVLDNLGLIDAIEWHCREFTEQTGIKSVFKTELDNIELEKNMEIAIFRIFQESLTNVARHADATEVTVELFYDENNIILKINDNGKGITQRQINAKKSFGLLGMMERAVIFNGEVSIKGKRREGTKVLITMPLDAV